MLCAICNQKIVGTVHNANLHGVDLPLCDWDALRLKDLICGVSSYHMSNIFWGFGHINWTCWYSLREIIRSLGIKEVLEFGIGLSSELFVNEGLQVIGFDVHKEHVNFYQNLKPLLNDATFHHYEDNQDGPPVETLYPGRTWDFVFVDGPQKRANEVRAAMRVAKKYIYLHDPHLGEEDFFPNEDWVGIGTEPKLFVKKGINFEE